MHTLSDGATSAPVSPPDRCRTLHAFRSCCVRTKSFIFLYRDSRYSPSDLCRPAPLWACALAVPLPRASQQLSLPQKLFQMLLRVLPGLQRRPQLCTLRLRSLMHGVHAASATPAARREGGSARHRQLEPPQSKPTHTGHRNINAASTEFHDAASTLFAPRSVDCGAFFCCLLLPAFPASGKTQLLL